MALGYADVPTRDRDEGALDKAILMTEVADSLTMDRDFNEFVLRKVAKAGNPADQQIMTWCDYVESLPYRRENGEVYRAWREIVGYDTGVPAGGDCDDLTILLVGGIRSLGVQSIVEILKDQQGWGFHVRARVGLPPHNPTRWVVVDPVWRSEREWAMVDQAPGDNAIERRAAIQSPRTTQELSSSLPIQSWMQSSSLSLPLLLLSGSVIWWWMRSLSPTRPSYKK